MFIPLPKYISERMSLEEYNLLSPEQKQELYTQYASQYSDERTDFNQNILTPAWNKRKQYIDLYRLLSQYDVEDPQYAFIYNYILNKFGKQDVQSHLQEFIKDNKPIYKHIQYSPDVTQKIMKSYPEMNVEYPWVISFFTNLRNTGNFKSFVGDIKNRYQELKPEEKYIYLSKLERLDSRMYTESIDNDLLSYTMEIKKFIEPYIDFKQQARKFDYYLVLFKNYLTNLLDPEHNTEHLLNLIENYSERFIDEKIDAKSIDKNIDLNKYKPDTQDIDDIVKKQWLNIIYPLYPILQAMFRDKSLDRDSIVFYLINGDNKDLMPSHIVSLKEDLDREIIAANYRMKNRVALFTPYALHSNKAQAFFNTINIVNVLSYFGFIPKIFSLDNVMTLKTEGYDNKLVVIGDKKRREFLKNNIIDLINNIKSKYKFDNKKIIDFVFIMPNDLPEINELKEYLLYASLSTDTVSQKIHLKQILEFESDTNSDDLTNLISELKIEDRRVEDDAYPGSGLYTESLFERNVLLTLRDQYKFKANTYRVQIVTPSQLSTNAQGFVVDFVFPATVLESIHPPKLKSKVMFTGEAFGFKNNKSVDELKTNIIQSPDGLQYIKLVNKDSEIYKRALENSGSIKYNSESEFLSVYFEVSKDGTINKCSPATLTNVYNIKSSWKKLFESFVSFTTGNNCIFLNNYNNKISNKELNIQLDQNRILWRNYKESENGIYLNFINEFVNNNKDNPEYLEVIEGLNEFLDEQGMPKVYSNQESYLESMLIQYKMKYAFTPIYESLREDLLKNGVEEKHIIALLLDWQSLSIQYHKALNAEEAYRNKINISGKFYDAIINNPLYRIVNILYNKRIQELDIEIQDIKQQCIGKDYEFMNQVANKFILHKFTKNENKIDIPKEFIDELVNYINSGNIFIPDLKSNKKISYKWYSFFKSSS